VSLTKARLEPGAVTVSDTVRVLFLGGQARSGSTLLDRALGQVAGFCSVGEVRYLFRRGLADNELCGCGTPLRSCDFWTRVGIEAFGGWDRIDLGELLWLQREVDVPSRIPLLLAPQTTPSYATLLRRYGEYLQRTFVGVRRASGADVVVDSTMSPPYALVLRQVSGIDLRVVHLVRDARGVAYSSAKKVARPESTSGTDYMPVYRPSEAATRWVLANALFENLARSVSTIRVRYEQFVGKPESELRRIASHAGVDLAPDSLDFVRQGTLELGVGHTAAGNPMRFETGTVVLREDERWRSVMDRGQQRLVTALAWPLLLRYGYLGREAGWRRTP
jgi:sulfotransferase family protein